MKQKEKICGISQARTVSGDIRGKQLYIGMQSSKLKEYGWEVCNEGENGRSIPRRSREIDLAVQTLCRTEADCI